MTIQFSPLIVEIGFFEFFGDVGKCVFEEVGGYILLMCYLLILSEKSGKYLNAESLF